MKIFAFSLFNRGLLHVLMLAASGAALAQTPAPAGPDFQVNTTVTGDGGGEHHPAVAVGGNGNTIVVWESEDEDGHDSAILARLFAADGTPIGSEFLVNTHFLSYQMDPVVAMDADGNFVIVWVSRDQDGAGGGVYAQRYAANGTPVGGEFQVNTATDEYQFNPALAMNADGNFVIVWESRDQDGAGGGIYAQRYAASGTPEGGEFLVNTTTDGDQTTPAVGMDAGGNFTVAWVSDGHGLHAQRYDANGAPLGGEFLVNTSDDGLRHLAMAMGASGQFVVTWMYFNLDGNSAGIFARHYAADGEPLGGEFPVNSTSEGRQERPTAAMGADGAFVIAWTSEPDYDEQDHRSDVFAQRYTAGGVPEGGEIPVNPTPEGSQEDPAIGMNTDGPFTIVWKAADGQNGYGIFGRRFAADGVPLEGEFRASGQRSEQEQPVIAMDADGDFVVAWTSIAQDGDRRGIVARRFRADGTAAGGEFPVNTTTESDQSNPAVAMDDAGTFIIVWNGPDDPTSGIAYDGILARLYAADGTPIGDEFVVNTTTEEYQTNPAVAMDAAGNVVVVWAGYEGFANRRIFARRFAADGTPLGSEFLVSSPTAGYAFRPAVAMDADGDFVITWRTPDQVSLAQRYAADGTPQGAAFEVCPSGIQSDDCTVSMDDAGGFIISWAVPDQDGYGDVYARRYAADGTPLDGAFQVNTTALFDQKSPTIAIDAAGDFVIAWESLGQDGSGYGVYAQRYAPDGSRSGEEFQVNATTTFNQTDQVIAMAADGHFVVAWEHLHIVNGSGGIFARRFSPQGISPVEMAAERLADLIETVQALSIHHGTRAALLSTLTDAQTSLQGGDLQNTIDELTAFVNQCHSQRGKKLAKETADALIAEARAIIEWLETEASAGKTAAEASTEAAGLIPEGFVLEANYPNPFNPSTEIAFSLPEAVHVELVIYDAVGREVRRLVDGPLAAGTHRVRWQAGGLPSGVYLYRLVSGRFAQTRPMTLVK